MPYQPSQFVTCPKCNGVGKTPAGLVCNECGGIGLGTFIKNDFLYWGYDMTPAKIIIRQSQVIFDNIIDIIFLVLGAGGIISLIWWLAQNAVAENNKIYLGALISFWGATSNLILYFWAGLLLLLFSYYRFQRRNDKYPPVKILTYKEKEKLARTRQEIPNNWRELKIFKTKIDVSRAYSADLLKLIEKSYAYAMLLGQAEVLPAHLLFTAINESAADKKNKALRQLKEILGRLGVYRGKISPKLEQILGGVRESKKTILNFSKELKQSLIEAYVIAQENGHGRIGMDDVIIPLASNGELIKRILAELAVSTEQVELSSLWQSVGERLRQLNKKTFKRRHKSLKEKMVRATGAVATPVLDYFCTDLTAEALFSKQIIFIGRERELSEIFKALAEKNTKIALVGKAGAGRVDFIKNLSQLIICKEAPGKLLARRLLLLDLTKFNSGGHSIDLKQKIAVLALELTKANGILFIPEASSQLVQAIHGSGGQASFIVNSNEAVSGWNNINFFEPSKDELRRMLVAAAAAAENDKAVNFNYLALEVIAAAAQNYQSDEALPGRAIKLLQKIVAAENADKIITAEFAAKVLSDEIKVPYTKILKEIR